MQTLWYQFLQMERIYGKKDNNKDNKNFQRYFNSNNRGDLMALKKGKNGLKNV